jgi:branched-chain amino acid transport system ATP-binding protein
VTRPGTSLARVLRMGGKLDKGTPVLEVEDVVLRFEGVTAIDGVSFDVHPHELFTIIGPNGAGKTSMFNCLSGLYRPQQGSIRFLGKNIVGRSAHSIARMGMARTFQNVELFHNLTVVENLMLGRHHHITYGPLAAMVYLGPARRQEISYREVVEEIIGFLEIEPYRHHAVGVLPYGIKKRVELGRALAMEPTLLLLDEPVTGMNVEETEDMTRFILDIREELEIPMILVEHDMGVVMDIADRVLVVDFGRPIACDVPEKIQQNTAVMRAYLGKEHAEASSAAASGGERK